MPEQPRHCPNPLCAEKFSATLASCPRCATRFDFLSRFTGWLTRMRMRLERPLLAVFRLPRWAQRIAYWLAVLLWLYALTQLPFMRRGLSQWTSPIDKLIWTFCNPLYWLVTAVAAFLAQLARSSLPQGLRFWLLALPGPLQWVVVLVSEASVMLALTRGQHWSKLIQLVALGWSMVLLHSLARYCEWRLFRNNNYRAVLRG